MREYDGYLVCKKDILIKGISIGEIGERKYIKGEKYPYNKPYNKEDSYYYMWSDIDKNIGYTFYINSDYRGDYRVWNSFEKITDTRKRKLNELSRSAQGENRLLYFQSPIE